jgi:hypothetical protein
MFLFLAMALCAYLCIVAIFGKKSRPFIELLTDSTLNIIGILQTQFAFAKNRVMLRMCLAVRASTITETLP